MLNSSVMRLSASGAIVPPTEGERRTLNSELWHACAGPLVSLPMVGSRVVYFPQGHSEQVAASTQREVDAHIPHYPSLPPQLTCQLHNITLHADIETDEVYCQMTLQPVNVQERESFLIPDMGSQNRQPTNSFCKTLTASDTSTHGGFSIPRRAAEKVFPPLDFSQTPPAQELVAKDLHGTEWKFRHIYRGQPKRHLLTTGWSVFVSAKRLTAGDSVLFIRNEKNQLLLGIRRANRPQTVMPSSMLSSDSMHIGIVAAAAHAASTYSRFTVFYNPRASPSEFVIPYSKYEKAVYHTQVSVGMRFRMLFETEESSVRRYMGTITGIGDLDAVRWPKSQWRSIKVGWDESTAGERQRRVSLWEIEPLTTFLLCPPSSNWRLKRPWPQPIGAPLTAEELEMESLKKTSMWMRNQNGDSGIYGLTSQGMAMSSWGHMQPRFESSIEPEVYDALGAAALQEIFPSKNFHLQQQSVQPDQMLYRLQCQPRQHPHYLCQQQQRQQTQQPQQQLPQHQLQQHHHDHQQQQPQPSLAQAQPPVLQQPPLPVQHQNQSSVFQQQLQQPVASLQQQSQQHTLPQSHNSLAQQLQTHGTYPELMHQQVSISLPNGTTGISRLSSSQPQVVLNSAICTPQSTVTDSSTTLGTTANSRNAFPLQSILSNFATDANALHSNFVTTAQPIIQHQSGILSGSESQQDSTGSTSWLPPAQVTVNQTLTGFQSELSEAARPVAGACVLSQSDPVALPNFSAPTLSSTSFSCRDYPEDQDALQSELHRQMLFGVNIDQSSIIIPTSLPASSRVYSTNSDFQSQCASQLIQGQQSVVGMDVPLSTSLFNGGLDDSHFLQTLSQVNPPTRTYTKVFKFGCVGRSIDVTRFSNYDELRRELAHMFGLERQLEDPRSGWQLVFIDKENDCLLLGDDPWESFVNNVKCIGIQSPSEVMQAQGMGLQSSFTIPRQTSSSSEDGTTQQDSRNPSSVITSACSLEY